MPAPRISLDQWLALVTVVEQGGYAQAAERLHKSQSTVSYAVKRIEHLLGIDVFEIQGRRAVLTPAGNALYRRGRALVDEAERVERTAASLAAGWEAEIAVAIETIFPTWMLLDCMADFADEHPDIRIELYESVMSGTNELLLGGQVDLAVTSSIPPGFAGDPLMQVRIVAVAAPDHPLHQMGNTLTLDDLRAERHLVIRDSGTSRTRRAHWEGSHERWTVSHKATSIRAARMGLGFSWFAEEVIREELDSGALKPLPLREGAERWGTLYLVYADNEAKGRGVERFGALLAEHADRCNSAVGEERDA